MTLHELVPRRVLFTCSCGQPIETFDTVTESWLSGIIRTVTDRIRRQEPEHIGHRLLFTYFDGPAALEAGYGDQWDDMQRRYPPGFEI